MPAAEFIGESLRARMGDAWIITEDSPYQLSPSFKIQCNHISGYLSVHSYPRSVIERLTPTEASEVAQGIALSLLACFRSRLTEDPFQSPVRMLHVRLGPEWSVRLIPPIDDLETVVCVAFSNQRFRHRAALNRHQVYRANPGQIIVLVEHLAAEAMRHYEDYRREMIIGFLTRQLQRQKVRITAAQIRD